jgi:hypothetical protein
MRKKQIVALMLGISVLMVVPGCEKKPNANKMPYSEAIDVCGMIKDEMDFPSTFEVERVDYHQGGETGLIDYYWVEFSDENAYGVKESGILKFYYEGGVLKTVNDADEESRQKSFDIFTDDGENPDEIQRLDTSFIMENLK